MMPLAEQVQVGWDVCVGGVGAGVLKASLFFSGYSLGKYFPWSVSSTGAGSFFTYPFSSAMDPKPKMF